MQTAADRRSPAARTRIPIAVVAAALAVSVIGGVRAQERPSGPTETCVTAACHPKIVTHKVMHGPVAQQKCMACHAYEDPAAHRFGLAEPSGRLCTTCHVFQNRTYAHEPVRQGNCTGCHDPHGSEYRMMLVADPVHGLCVTCHREPQDDAKFVHGPVAAGACILCHEAHSSWEPKLLTEPVRDLCLGCHEEMSPHRNEQRYPHAPVAEGCLSCHDAHASGHRYQLHEDAPGLCFTCHDGVRTALESAQVVHGAMLDPGGCVACHNAHGGQLPALQRAEQTAMCLGCHDKTLTTDQGRHLTNMAALLRDNPHHHGPIREGACSACHEPHAAGYPRLLRQAYPPEFYAPFEAERYELCFECHIPQIVESEHGTGLTRFRDGDRNLHWLHVNREKGRTCRACHEVHASKNPFHIRDTVPFGTGGWELEIGYRQTDGGGTCTPGCHKRVEYNRGPVPQPVPPAMGGGT